MMVAVGHDKFWRGIPGGQFEGHLHRWDPALTGGPTHGSFQWAVLLGLLQWLWRASTMRLFGLLLVLLVTATACGGHDHTIFATPPCAEPDDRGDCDHHDCDENKPPCAVPTPTPSPTPGPRNHLCPGIPVPLPITVPCPITPSAYPVWAE